MHISRGKTSLPLPFSFLRPSQQKSSLFDSQVLELLLILHCKNNQEHHSVKGPLI